jgi:hypothetical protein
MHVLYITINEQRYRQVAARLTDRRKAHRSRKFAGSTAPMHNDHSRTRLFSNARCRDTQTVVWCQSRTGFYSYRNGHSRRDRLDNSRHPIEVREQRRTRSSTAYFFRRSTKINID